MRKVKFFICFCIISVFSTNPAWSQLSTVTYTCIGSSQNFIVPPCVTQITVKSWGGGGGGGGVDSYQGGTGGGGSYVEADISVTPGETLLVYVGCKGQRGDGCSGGAIGGTGGWGYGIAGNGGNAGPSGCSGSGGGGGGASALTRGTTLLIAAGGGGGGGGGGCTSVGGNGGYGGTNGANTTCTSGGATGGNSNPNGTNGGTINQDGGGGGGGGGGATNGGNGGSAPPPGPSCNSANDCGAGGGGAGNSFVPPGGTLLNASGQTPGNSGDSDLCGGCAAGGNGQTNGGDGIVVILWNSSPSAAFSATSVCYGNDAFFVDQSCNSVVNWIWNFGDGSPIDTTQNPSHFYSSPGLYTVTLIVNDSLGISDTAQNNINIYPLSLADFVANNACLNDLTVFNDTSTIASGNIVAWLWGFGDGPPAGSSTFQNPTYIFNTPDTFIVTLAVTSDSGCASIVGYQVVVYPLPVADFTTANVCLYDDAVFTETSIIISGSVTSWQWDFGDNTSSILKDPTHLYNADSTYIVTLIVTSNNGCLDTIVQPIQIYPVPVAGFNTNNVCLYDPAVFTDTSSVSSGTIISWNWDFGDGTSIIQNPTHLYSTDGTYNVSLIVTTNNNCIDTMIQSLIIYPVPSAGFTTGPVCLYDAAVFIDISTINVPDTVVSWQWDFGDIAPGDTSTIQNPSYNYGSAGLYNAQLTVTSNNGCTENTGLTIEIYPLPIANFTSDIASGCEPICVNFSDLTIITGSTINFRDWDFGDGNSSTLQNPENCYMAINVNTTRISTVTLIATSSDGCVDTSTNINMITVWPNPIAVYIAEPQPTTILNPVINFIDQSQGDTIAWAWDFGDSISSGTDFVQNPVHEYSDTGTYIVEQIIVNQFSCSDTFYRTVIIQPGYIFHVPSAFTPNDDDINETFIPQGVGIDEENFEMFIYDRWGNLIYETNDIKKPWDGSANNGRKIAQQDVYVWVIFTRDMQGARHKYLGRVTLIR